VEGGSVAEGRFRVARETTEWPDTVRYQRQEGDPVVKTVRYTSVDPESGGLGGGRVNVCLTELPAVPGRDVEGEDGATFFWEGRRSAMYYRTSSSAGLDNDDIATRAGCDGLFRPSFGGVDEPIAYWYTQEYFEARFNGRSNGRVLF